MRRPWTIAAAAAAAACAACSPGLDNVRVPSRGRTMIVVQAHGETIDRAVAIRPSESSAYYGIPRASGETYVLEYECTPEELGIAEGELTVAQSGRGTGLPNTASVSIARGGDLARVADVPAVLRAAKFELPEPSPCIDFHEAGTHTLPDTRSPMLNQAEFIMPFAEDRALVSTTDGKYFYISTSGIVEDVTDRPWPYPNALAAYRSQPDEIYLLFAGGRVEHGFPDRLFTTGTRRDRLVDHSIFKVAWLVGPAPGRASNFEMFAVADYGDLEWYRPETGWTQLISETATTGRDLGDGAALVWLGEGRAAAVGRVRDSIEIIDNGQIRDVWRHEGEVLTTAVLGSDGFLLVGTASGIVYRQTDRNDYSEVATGLFKPIRSIIPVEGATLFVDSFNIREIRAGSSCAAVTLEDQLWTGALVGEDLVVLTANAVLDNGFVNDIQYTVLKPKRPAKCRLSSF